MPAGDIYSLQDEQSFLGECCMNTYFIKHVSGSGVAQNLTRAFRDGPHVNVNSVQSTAVTDVEISAQNLTDLADFDTRTTLLAGVRVGEPMPPYAAWGFTLFTTDRTVRAGGKRYVGVSESDQSNGTREAGIIPAHDGLENALNSVFEDTVSGDVFKITLYTAGNSKTPTPETPAEVAVASVAYARLTTQSSRKFA